MHYFQDPTNTLLVDVPIPTADCPYEAPDECTGAQPQACCERLEMPSSATPQTGFYPLLYTGLYTIMAAYVCF